MKTARLIWAAPFLSLAAVLVITIVVLVVLGLGWEGAEELFDRIA